MKKFLSIILAALMLVGCLTAFAGCGSKKADELAQVALSSAADYLKSMYKNDAETTARDYDVAGKLIIGDIEYTVTWTVDTDKVSIKESETAGFYTVDVPDETAEEIPYVITATIADAEGRTVEVSFKHVVPKLEAVKVEADKKIVLALKDGDVTKYVSGIHYLYTSSSGSKKWELKITEDKAEALPMVMKENDDKTVSFVAEDKYLLCDATNVQFVDEASDNTKYVLETATGGTFIKCAVANYGGKPQYLEMYSGYLTCYGMNESKPELYTFIIEDAGDAAGKIDIPSDTTTPDTPETPDTPDTTPITELTAVTAPVAETAYKLFLTQVSLKKNLFAIGELDQEKFYKTTETAADAPDFYVEAVDGGFKFYTTIDGAKKYVDASIVAKEDGKTSKVLSYTDSTETVWTYKEEVNAWLTTIEGEDYVIGTYGTYATLSISAATYITAENTGKTQFPAHLVLKSDAENFTPDTPDTPETPDDTETPDTPAGEATIADVLAAEDGTAVVVKGIVSEIKTAWSDQYNNISVFITDGTNKVQCFRLATKVEVGDIVVVTGTVGSFSGEKQIAQGATAEVTKPTAIDAAAALEDNADVIVMGTVSEIKTAWSDQYNNISVFITDGTNKIQCFRLATKVEVGDIIVVTGKVGSFSGEKQIAQGATAVIIGKAESETPPTDPTPSTPAEPAGEKFAIAASAGTLATDGLSISWASTNYSILCEQHESRSAIRVTDTDHFRVYVGSKLTISAAAGKKIAKATVVCQSADYAASMVAALTTAGVTATANEANVIITVADAAGVDSVSFIPAKQFRITTIYVEFVA